MRGVNKFASHAFRAVGAAQDLKKSGSPGRRPKLRAPEIPSPRGYLDVSLGVAARDARQFEVDPGSAGGEPG